MQCVDLVHYSIIYPCTCGNMWFVGSLSIIDVVVCDRIQHNVVRETSFIMHSTTTCCLFSIQARVVLDDVYDYSVYLQYADRT